MITKDEYTGFQVAYDYFNMFLFYSDLPNCMITIGHSKKYNGFFAGGRFTGRDDIDDKTDEICLNADGFNGRSDKEILSTLVHEMCHLWQHHHGKPSRSGYHNRQWFKKMIDVGLEPTGTGQRVSHSITQGGNFDMVAKQLLESDGFKLKWQSKARPSNPKKAKVKYTCPGCGVNLWGKPDLNILCGDCDETLV